MSHPRNRSFLSHVSFEVANRFGLVGFAALMLSIAPSSGFAHESAVHQAAAEMSSAANQFLASLTEEQRKQVVFPLTDDEHQNWHFVPDRNIAPNGRRGLPIKEMSPQQRALAHGLPATALSGRGYMQAMAIMALEKVLRDIEGSDHRDPELYYVTIFGEPTTEGSWGWRFEGHHLSVNVTAVGGEHFSVTPSFFGSNPAIVPSGPLKGLEVLKQEEQIALDLVNSLTAAQLAKATIGDVKPYDVEVTGKTIREVLTTDDPRVDKGRLHKVGIGYNDLDKSQQALLLGLIHEYAGRFRQAVLEGTTDAAHGADPSTLTFAWLGGMKRGEQHYYAIQSDVFLIEFANSQNNANHIHAVWRDIDGDFGRDLLGEHFHEHPHD